MQVPNRRQRLRARRGAAAVEFAMTAPVVFLLLFAALELGHANMVFHTTEAAAYEGARQGIVPGATARDCETASERILKVSGIQGAKIDVLPSKLDKGSESVEVRIQVPYANNSIVIPLFTKKLSIDRTCRLSREKL